MNNSYSRNSFYFLGCSLVLSCFFLLGANLRHAAGLTYALLLVISIGFLSQIKNVRLEPEDKWILGAVGFLFLAALGSSIANGWNENSTKGLGVQLRYLAFIPIYLMFRALPGLGRVSWWALVLGAFLLMIQSLNEVYLQGADRAGGVYNSPGYVALWATHSGLIFLCAILKPNIIKIPRTVVLLGFSSSMASLLLSGSRSTYFAIFVSTAFVFILRETTQTKRVVLLLFISLVVGVSINEIGLRQTSSALSEIYILVNEAHNSVGSVGQRIDMWRASILLFLDNPIWGVGWRNFSAQASSYVQTENYHQIVAWTPHPHSAYFNALATGGLVGLVAFLSFFLVPYKIARAADENDSGWILTIKTFITFFAANAIFEGGLLIYNNTSSFILLLMAVLFASMINERCESRPR